MSDLHVQTALQNHDTPSPAFDIHRQRAMALVYIRLRARYRRLCIRRYTDRAGRQIVAFFGPVSWVEHSGDISVALAQNRWHS